MRTLTTQINTQSPCYAKRHTKENCPNEAAIEPAPVSVREAARVLLDSMPEITAKPLVEMSDVMEIDAHPAILLRGFCAALRAITEGKDDE